MNLYIARQPILDTNEQTFAYELLYRNENITADIKANKQATLHVIGNALNSFGLQHITHGQKAFIKVDQSLLMHEVMLNIPQEHFVFSLMSSTMEYNTHVQERIKELSALGYVFAIDDCVFTSDILNKITPILEHISYIKVDVRTPQENLEVLKECNAKRIFTKVETFELLSKAQKNGAHYVQGYFFAHPKVFEQKRFDKSKIQVLKLCNIIMEKQDIDEIVLEIQKHHSIAISLLQFINSSKFSFRSPVSSLKQVLTLLGKSKLVQWLMLMVYTTQSDDGQIETTSLMDLVENRTNLLVDVAQKIDDSEEFSSKAYFTGIISLLDALFHVPLEDIIYELNLDEEISAALLERKGVLGDLLRFAENVESFNIEAIEEFSKEYKIYMQDLQSLSIRVIKSADDYQKEIGSG